MKNRLLAGVALIAIASSANAADMPIKAPVYPAAAAYNWTGFYLGLNAGVGVSGSRVPTDPGDIIASFPAGSGDADGLYKAGFSGGFQAGYNWQLAPSWVLGIEGDVGVLSANSSICDLNDCQAAENINISSRSGFLGTLRGRLGYAWDRSLLYVTGGAAWVGLKDNWTGTTNAPTTTTFSEVSTTKAGWTLGGGIETALTGNWTVKTEYLFINPGDVTVMRSNGDGSYLTFQHQLHVARVGLNYKFGDGLAPGAPAAMPLKAPRLTTSPYNWTGFYVGGNAGVGIAGTHVTTDPTTLIGDANGDNDDLYRAGFTGGGQAGYNWQFAPSWVAGIEGDVGVLKTNEFHCNINDCDTANSLSLASDSSFFATLRARVGYAWDRSLLYVTGGAAWVRTDDRWTDFTTTFSENSTIRAGWAVGGGLETALMGNWTAKIEYLFVDVGTNRVFDADGDGSYLDFKHQYHVARLGLNYKFDQMPVVSSRY